MLRRLDMTGPVMLKVWGLNQRFRKQILDWKYTLGKSGCVTNGHGKVWMKHDETHLRLVYTSVSLLDAK
jgi:hypothetical protein